jgi:hypothetical protein
MCTREMVEWQRRRLLDSSCNRVLVLSSILLVRGVLYILAAANEQLSVMDNRLSPDLLADSFRQLGDTFLPAPRDSFAVAEDDVDLRDVDPISLQGRPKRKLCLCTTKESWARGERAPFQSRRDRHLGHCCEVSCHCQTSSRIAPLRSRNLLVGRMLRSRMNRS